MSLPEGFTKLCACQGCGKIFRKGTEGDNEEFCLRCERQALTANMDDLERDDFDRISEHD